MESVREVKGLRRPQIEKQVRADKRWEIGLRLDDGSVRTLPAETEPAWRAGHRVRIVDDQLQAI